MQEHQVSLHQEYMCYRTVSVCARQFGSRSGVRDSKSGQSQGSRLATQIKNRIKTSLFYFLHHMTSVIVSGSRRSLNELIELLSDIYALFSFSNTMIQCTLYYYEIQLVSKAVHQISRRFEVQIWRYFTLSFKDQVRWPGGDQTFPFYRRESRLVAVQSVL